MKIVDYEQNSPEWLTYRRNKIGASDSPIICGVSPHRSPYSLWLDKLGLYTQEETDAMRRGKELEPIARKMFEEMMGEEFPAIVAEHDTIPYLAASLDGYNECKAALLEIKCSTRNNHEMVEKGIIPQHWMYQIQHQLMVTGAKKGYLCSFYNGEIMCYPVDHDLGIQEEILAKSAIFWDNLQTFTAPEMTDKDYISRNDDQWYNLALQYRQTKDKIEDLESLSNGLRRELLGLSQGMSCKGGGIKLLKCAKKGNIQYSDIPQLQGLDLEQYRKPPIEYFRITMDK